MKVSFRLRVALIVGLAALALVAAIFLPPVPQDLRYHSFADRRTLWGVANFWNVVSNLPFLMVAFVWSAGIPVAHGLFPAVGAQGLRHSVGGRGSGRLWIELLSSSSLTIGHSSGTGSR
jgi:hypothetical protein